MSEFHTGYVRDVGSGLLLGLSKGGLKKLGNEEKHKSLTATKVEVLKCLNVDVIVFLCSI